MRAQIKGKTVSIEIEEGEYFHDRGEYASVSIHFPEGTKPSVDVQFDGRYVKVFFEKKNEAPEILKK